MQLYTDAVELPKSWKDTWWSSPLMQALVWSAHPLQHIPLSVGNSGDISGCLFPREDRVCTTVTKSGPPVRTFANVVLSAPRQMTPWNFSFFTKPAVHWVTGALLRPLYRPLRGFKRSINLKSVILVASIYLRLTLMLSFHHEAYARNPAFWLPPAFKRWRDFTAKKENSFPIFAFCTLGGL